MRKLWLLLFLVVLPLASAQDSRHFTFHYGFTVKNVPAGERVRVWIPAARSDDFQEVKVISANGDLKLKKTRESRFGNQMYYAESSKEKSPDLHFEVIYDVVRHERLTMGVARPRLAEVQLKESDRKQYLQPDKLVPVTGLPADLALKVTAGDSTPLEKARAIYDYVFTTMLWVTITMVNFSFNWKISSSILPVEIGSRAEQGSSMSSTCGSTARARAIQSRCCWPPERLAPDFLRIVSFTSSQRAESTSERSTISSRRL